MSPLAIPCEHGVTFAIQPPEGWIATPPVPPARLYLVDPNAPQPLPPAINVMVQELGNLTPDEYLTVSRLQYKSIGSNAVVEVDEPLGPSRGGHVFEILFPAEPTPIRFRQLVLMHAGLACVVTAMAPADLFEAYRERFQKALDSVILRIAAADSAC